MNKWVINAPGLRIWNNSFYITKHRINNNGWIMKWRWREGVERSENPNILRECWTFLIRIFLLQLRKQLPKILRLQTQEKFADIWLGLTIQTVIPIGLCYLTFVCKNKQGNHCNWHKSFKELGLRKVQHYLSSLKRRKPLQFWSHWHCCQKTTTSLRM